MISVTLNFETPQLGTPIKNDFLAQIEHHKEQKRLARLQQVTLDKGVIELRDKILAQLNADLGTELWKLDSHSFNKIGFVDVRRNTCYNTWDLKIYYDLREVKYGQLTYQVPNVDKGIYLTLIPSRANDNAYGKCIRENRRESYKRVEYVITDLAKIHELCNANYLEYFTINAKI